MRQNLHDVETRTTMPQAPCAGSGAGLQKQIPRTLRRRPRQPHPGCSGGGNRRGEDTAEKCPALARPVVKTSSASYSSRRKQSRCVGRSEAGVASFESVEFALSCNAEMRERRCAREILTIPPNRSRLPFAVRMQNEAYPTALKSTVIRHLMTGGRAVKTAQLRRSQHSPSPIACETDAGATGGTRRC